jgi:hypothetical protein
LRREDLPRPGPISADLFGGVDLLETANVPTPFEPGFEPGVHDRAEKIRGHHAGTDGNDVGVVVKLRQAGALVVPDHAAADALDLVGDDRFAVATAAEDDPGVGLAPGHRLRRRTDEIGVVARDLILRAEVEHFDPAGFEVGLNNDFGRKTSVIGAEGNLHRAPSNGQRPAVVNGNAGARAGSGGGRRRAAPGARVWNGMVRA